MRTAETIIGLIGKRGKKGLPLERVYKLLFSRDLYLEAYGKIYRNDGAMTHGVTDERLTGCRWQRLMPSLKPCDMSGISGYLRGGSQSEEKR